MARRLPSWTYDPALQIAFGTFAKAILTTEADVEGTLEVFEAFWRAKRLSQKVYAIVDYNDFEMAPHLVPAYAAMVKKALDRYLVTIVRYGGNEIQRTNARLIAIRNHVPSRLYATRAEAIHVVKGLRDGVIGLGDPPAG